MSSLVLSKTTMYKDRVSSDTGHNKSFCYCFVSKKMRNKTGYVKSSGWMTSYFIHGRAPRSREKGVTDDTMVVVSVT